MSELPVTDEALLSQIARRERDALEQLYDRHAPIVYNVIVRIVRQPGVADELLQETFWQVWCKAADYQGQGPAAAWIYRIARNKSLDQLRRWKARPQAEATQSAKEEQALWADLAATTPQVDEVAEQRWNRNQVRQALLSIPDEQRLCLELAYFEGMSQRQIAEHTAAPLGTIKTRIRMGLQKLERILRASGY